MLMPHQLKRSVFEEAIALAPLYGKLVHQISLDPAFIEQALAQYGKALCSNLYCDPSCCSVSDEFTVKLVDIMKKVVAEGIKQVPLHALLGLFALLRTEPENSLCYPPIGLYDSQRRSYPTSRVKHNIISFCSLVKQDRSIASVHSRDLDQRYGGTIGPMPPTTEPNP